MKAIIKPWKEKEASYIANYWVPLRPHAVANIGDRELRVISS